jgi:uncharacterized membrane protein YdjX (TVP38/TMEM64 family)
MTGVRFSLSLARDDGKSAVLGEEMRQVTEKQGGEGQGKSGLWRPIALLAVIVAIIVLSQVFGVGEKLGALRGWIDSLDFWGPLVFMVIYAAATVAALPGSAMTLIAGSLFGPIVGVAAVIVAATLGATLAFLVSRYFAREAVAQWLSTKEKFRQLDDLTEKHGAIVVALTRLVPIFPFNLLNYGFGLTKVPLWTYVLWSGLCMLPGTIMYVVIGASLFEAIAKGRVPWILIAVVIVLLVAMIFIGKYARRRLLAGGKGQGQ